MQNHVAAGCRSKQLRKSADLESAKEGHIAQTNNFIADIGSASSNLEKKLAEKDQLFTQKMLR